MSRGPGSVQRYLVNVLGAEPMTFDEVLNRAYPPGSFEGDMAKEFGGANVGRVRSLRRALFKLCEDDVVQICGIKRPHSYRLHPTFLAFQEALRQRPPS
jgi:hypothetical protein